MSIETELIYAADSQIMSNHLGEEAKLRINTLTNPLNSNRSTCLILWNIHFQQNQEQDTN